LAVITFNSISYISFTDREGEIKVTLRIKVRRALVTPNYECKENVLHLELCEAFYLNYALCCQTSLPGI
jgi:hypothetical protein